MQRTLTILAVAGLLHALVGCASSRQVAILLQNSTSREPVSAKLEINRVVDERAWTLGPFGRTYETMTIGSSLPGEYRFFTVGDRDVINVYAPGFETTRIQIAGRRAYVMRGEWENLLQLIMDRTWIDRSSAQRRPVPRNGVLMIPLAQRVERKDRRGG